MSLFEILFIALFILFPIMEQVMRRRRAEAEESDSDELGPDPMETGPGEVSPRSSEREPIQASEMVPDDLWAVLTGETRHPEGVEREEEPEEPEEPWSDSDPRWEPEPEEPPAVVSLETPLDSAEARHRRFHDIIDRPVPRRPARRSRALRALRSQASVRQAFVLSEVLGKPKSLE